MGTAVDTDFAVTRLVERADRELANGLGNLINRTVSLVHRYRDGRVSDRPPAPSTLPGQVDAALARFDLRAATDAIWRAVEHGNRLVERERPWELARDSAAAGRLDTVLATLVHLCREVAKECRPFVPEGAARLATQLSRGATVGPTGAAFARLAA